MSTFKTALLLFATASLATTSAFAQQPTIANVTSAAYYNYAASGGLATIWGSNLSDSTYAATTTPLPTQLGPTSVQVCPLIFQSGFTQGPASCLPADLIFVSPGQINFAVPPNFYTGDPANITNAGGIQSPTPVGIKVTVGALTVSVTAQILGSAPQIFEMGSDCNFDPLWGDTTACGITAAQLPAPRAVRGAITDLSGTLVSSTNPARLGQFYVIYLTGLGLDHNGRGPDPFLDQSAYTVNFTLNHRPNDPLETPYHFSVVPTYAGATGFEGLQQINFVVNPSDVGFPIIPCQDLRFELQISIGGGWNSPSSTMSLPVLVKNGELACR